MADILVELRKALLDSKLSEGALPRVILEFPTVANAEYAGAVILTGEQSLKYELTARNRRNGIERRGKMEQGGGRRTVGVRRLP